MANSAVGRHTLSRPRTSPVRMSVKSALGKEDAKPGDYEIELLEYEWPDLPPISTMKDAITRRRVSHGISYLLPVDKCKNSINNHFRTNLRAMFQEPYASDDLRYNDSRVTLSAKVHFRSNTVDTKWTTEHLQSIPVELNSQSEHVRRLYSRSAPANSSSSKRMGIDPSKLRKRSNLYLQIKAKVPPEALKIRKEVEEIIKRVQEDDDEYDEDEHAKVGVKDEVTRPADGVTATCLNDGMDHVRQSATSLNTRIQRISDSRSAKQKLFSRYEELRSAKPPSMAIPECCKSEFLNDEKNQDIWNWLHVGEEMDEFEYFLSVCG